MKFSKRMLIAMKYSLRMRGISIACLFGFYSVSANALNSNNENTVFNPVLYNDIAVYLDVDDYSGIPFNPATLNEKNDTAGADADSDFRLNELEEADRNAGDIQEISVPGVADSISDTAGMSSFGLPKFDKSVTTGVHTHYDLELYEGEKAGLDVNHYQDLTVSGATIDMGNAAGISSFGLPKLGENATNLEPLEVEGTAPTSTAATSSQSAFVNKTESPSPGVVTLERAADAGNKFADDNASNEENGMFVPELEIYAMLLVFLGLMGFTARRRRDIV